MWNGQRVIKAFSPPFAPRIILYHASSHNTPSSISLPASFHGTFAALLGCAAKESHMATKHSPFNLPEDQTPSSVSVLGVTKRSPWD